MYFSSRLEFIKPRDSLFCYNLETGAIDSKTSFKGDFLLVSPEGSLNLFKKEIDKKNHTFRLYCDHLNPKTLEKGSSQKLIEVPLVKKSNYSCSYALSPDSLMALCFLTVETSKNIYTHYYVLYDLKTDDFEKNKISFKTTTPYYSVMDINLTNSGEMIFVLKTYKTKNPSSISNIETLWFDRDGEYLKTLFSLPEGVSVKAFNSKVLRDGNLFFAAAVRNENYQSYGEYDLYYSVFDKRMIDRDIVKYEKYHFDDVWLEKQDFSLKNYSRIDIGYINELDNGRIMLTGYPYSVIENHYRWGAFFNLMFNPDGSLEKSSYIERMASFVPFSRQSTPSCIDAYYAAFAYGNNLYLLFNESVKKVESGKQDAGYKCTEPAYLTLWRIGEGEDKNYNLSGTAPSDFAFNSSLSRRGNKLYVLTRNDSCASVGWLDLPDEIPTRSVGKDAVVNGGSSESASTTQSVPAKAKSNPRKRSVKK